MGKGKGRGGHRGGCQLDTVSALTCCLCFILFAGPILIAVGAGILSQASRDQHGRNIASIQSAVDAWLNASSPNGWQQFQKLRLFAEVAPGADAEYCKASSMELQADTVRGDVYQDDAAPLFQETQQLRFVSPGISFISAASCQMQIRLLQLLPGRTTNVTLVELTDIFYGSSYYSIQLDKAIGGPYSCPTTSDTCAYSNYAKSCAGNCQYFGGVFSCNNGGQFMCTKPSVFFDNLAVKVAYNTTADTGPSGAYLPDMAVPGPGRGANVLPAGFSRTGAPGGYPGANSSSSSSMGFGSLFQVPNMGPSGPPATFTLTVRSSADPWLTYMAVTEGSGRLGVPKRVLVGVGVLTLLVGCTGTLFWCAVSVCVWRMLCSRNRPTERPQGMAGYAWDLANRFGGSYAPALGVPVPTSGPGGYPTAQPLYAQQQPQPLGPYDYTYGGYGNPSASASQPVTGYPYPAYPAPYGQPPQYPPQPAGAYPPYPVAYPPAAHGSAGVEMSQLGAGSPYTYPPPPPAPPGQQQQQQPSAAPAEGNAWGVAAYPYPYLYPPPYGQQRQQQQEQQQQQQPAAAGAASAAAAGPSSSTAPGGAPAAAAAAGSAAGPAVAEEEHLEAGPRGSRLLRPAGYTKLE